MTEILAISNSWPLWIACGILVFFVFVQSALFVRLCRKEADYIGYPQKKLNTAIVNGMITSVGPALAGIVVMISMMAVIGSPITWQRLSIIGAAQTELTIANLGAQAMGVELGSPGYNISALTLCFLLMAINGCGWLLVTTLCTGSMETVRLKLSGGDATWLGLLSAGATIGLFSNMGAQRLLAGAGPAAALIAGFVTQFVLDTFVAPKVKWIKGYAIAIALVVAMIVGYIVHPV